VTTGAGSRDYNSDTHGEFHVASQPKGTIVRLTITAEGFFPLVQERTLEDGTVFTVYPRATLDGIVRDRSNGAPVSEAKMFVVSGSFDPDPETVVMTDETGRYSGLPIPWGRTFQLSTQASGYQAIREALSFPMGQAPTQHEVLLDRSLIARVVVLDLENAAPVNGATIQARYGTYRTDRRGEAIIDHSLRPEETTHGMIVSAPGHCETVFEITNIYGLTSPVPLRLPRGCRIEGLVIDSTGTPLAGMRVESAYDKAEFQAQHDSIALEVPQLALQDQVRARIDLFSSNNLYTYTGEDGKFRFDGIPADLLGISIEVKTESRVIAHQEVEPLGPPGHIEYLVIQAGPASNASVHGRLLLNGEPVPGRVLWEGPSLGGRADIRGDGQFELHDVEPGEVLLVGIPLVGRTNLGKIAQAEKTIEVLSQSSVECDLAVELPMTTISGRVYQLGNQTHQAEKIHITTADPYGSFETTTGEGGSWAADVPRLAGEFRVFMEIPTLEGEIIAHAGDRDVDFHVGKLGTIRYRAVSAEDGNLIVGPWLQRRTSSGELQTVGMPVRNPADESGWHQADLPEGDYVLSAMIPGGKYRSDSKKIFLRSGCITEVVFELERSCIVRLELADGLEPLPLGRSVVLVAEAGWSQVHAQQGSDTIDWVFDHPIDDPQPQLFELSSGRQSFSLSGCSPGRFGFRAFPDDLVIEPEWIDVSANCQPITLHWRFRE